MASRFPGRGGETKQGGSEGVALRRDPLEKRKEPLGMLPSESSNHPLPQQKPPALICPATDGLILPMSLVPSHLEVAGEGLLGAEKSLCGWC